MKTLTREQRDQVTGGIFVPPFVVQSHLFGNNYSFGAVNLGPANSIFGLLGGAPFRAHLPAVAIGVAGTSAREDC